MAATLYTLLIQISYTGILQNSKEPVFLNSLIFICCCCCLVAQSHSTPWDLMDYSPQGSSVHRILQARLLKRVAVPFSSLSYYYCNCFGHHQRWWIWLISVCIWLLRGMTASPPPSLSSGLLIPWDTTILKLGPIHNPNAQWKEESRVSHFKSKARSD